MRKQKSDGVYFFWSAAMIVSVLLAVFVIMFASCSGGNEVGSEEAADASPSPSGAVSDSPAPEDPNVPASGVANSEEPVTPPETDGMGQELYYPGVPVELAETADMGQEYIDKMYFMGDSTTHGLASYGIIPEARVWTPLNGTLSIFRWNVDQISLADEGTTMFMTDAIAYKQPEYLLITLGVNGVGMLGEAEFKGYYSDMVDALMTASPNTKIILNTIYPVGKDYAEKSITNEKIDAANGWIRTIAEERGVRYLNSASVLKDENGFMVEGYDNGDDLHPNADTYNIIINYIRTHGYV